ncbi:hypothetical protein SNEBB_011453 [Seison nebaliae]|nr:hypothetical protein SNEBB_011453 [Seison nebaliae]
MFKLLLVIIYIISLASSAAAEVCENFPKFEKDDKTIQTAYTLMLEEVNDKYFPGEGSVFKFHCDVGNKFKQTDDENISYICNGKTGEWTSDSVGTNRRMDCVPA